MLCCSLVALVLPILQELPPVESFAYSDVARRSLAGGSDETPVTGGLSTTNIGYEPKTLNNILRVGHQPNLLCREYLFPPLLDLDEDSLELVPEVAASRPRILDGGRRMVWTLRPDVFWHEGDADGRPVAVSTRDVQYSWDMIHSPEVLAESVRGSLKRFKELRVLDEHRFELVVDPPYFKAEYNFGWNFRLMPAHLGPADPAEFQKDARAREPVGYGPYRLERWKAGQHITLVRNPGYWDRERRPFRIERLRFVFVRDTEKVLGMFLRGELTTCTINNADRWEAAKEDPQLQEVATFHEYFLPTFNFLGWNTKHWAFSDVRVRQAMTHLFPRQQVCDKFYRGHAQVVSGPFAFVAKEYDRSIAPLDHDPRRALELLAEAGFSDSDRDGVLDRDGRKFEFTLIKPSSRVPALERGIEVFQYHLRRAGILMEVQPLEFNTLLKRMREHDFDVGQLGWSPDPRDPDLYTLIHSSAADGGYNYMDHRDPELDRLLEEYRGEFDEARRLELAHRLHRMVHDAHVYTFLPTPQSLVMVSTRFRNVSISRRGAVLHDWWVPEE